MPQLLANNTKPASAGATLSLTILVNEGVCIMCALELMQAKMSHGPAKPQQDYNIFYVHTVHGSITL